MDMPPPDSAVALRDVSKVHGARSAAVTALDRVILDIASVIPAGVLLRRRPVDLAGVRE
jgi:hypothetical protein